MKTNDILAQIDEALGDGTVGPDAMRSTPAAEGPRLALSREARQILIRRLIDNRGLTHMSARHAVLAVEQGRDTQHAELVQAEARAAMDEFMQRIRAAVVPAVAAAGEALERMAEAFKQASRGFQASVARANGDSVEPPVRPSPPLPRRDGRPAWQTPYGPARRRR